MAVNQPVVRYPERRTLQTFAFDPMSTRLSGRFLRVQVPFERHLQPGPIGELVRVVDYDAARETWYRPVDLDDPAVLAHGGLRPREGDPRTHQQVVYAVAMSVIERFERFLGRRFRWRSDRALRLVPHAFEGRNAFFDPDRRAVLFGYYRADIEDPGANLPQQMMFTCLSTDIVAHEVTHALVHRLRRYYSEGTNPDVLAWHEAFADLIALFHHFAYPDVVAEAVAKAQGDLREGGGLFELADEFGRSTGRGAALRSAVKDRNPTPERYRTTLEPHERGALFVAGVFDAYLETYKVSIADLLRIATGGTGVLPPGSLHPDLVARIARESVRIAERFLDMVVRAFDYLPVVDVTFGDVVRAVVTADRVLYPDDESHLRRALVEALRRRGIFPQSVESLADDALVWPRPVVPGLSLAGAAPAVDLSQMILSATQDLDPRGEAGAMESEEEADPTDPGVTVAGRRIRAAPELVAWAAAHAVELGLDPAWDIALAGVHVAYRQAADRQPRPEIVLQFVQRRLDLEDQDAPRDLRVPMRAGTTVLASVDGSVDYVVAKPLPFSGPKGKKLPPGVAEAWEMHHKAGTRRLEQVRDWLLGLDERDALTAWTAQPAMRRLTFANLHAAIEGAE